MPDTNTLYDINTMVGFVIVGLLIKIFFGSITEDGSSGPASASIWGYGVVALAVISLLVISFGLVKDISTYSVFDFLKTLIQTSLPSFLTLVILLWIITINVIYFKRINQGKVANEYYSYSTLTTLILIFQIIVLFKYLKDSVNVQPSNNKMAYATYFLSFINFIFIGIMTIILEYFSTDG